MLSKIPMVMFIDITLSANDNGVILCNCVSISPISYLVIPYALSMACASGLLMELRYVPSR